jgi:LacI family transcriptional regulator
MPPTIYEVSKLAGVSLATVSRVMNNSGKVSPATRKKVEDAMRELGYRPNSAAQSLASNRTNSVGVIVPVFYGPFYGEMLAGVEEELRAARKHIIITSGDSEEEGEKNGIEFLLSRNCDALIMRLDAISDDYLVELASSDKTPFVVMDRHIPAIEDRCIYLDNELGGYLATKSVLVLGHRNIAYISGPLWKADAGGRFKGHKRALEEFGVEFDPRLFFEGNFQESTGNQGMEQLLQAGGRFSAVICANDEMAAGAFGVARERGMAIPGEISIMGFDNVFFTRYFRPRLSTVNNPVREMGQMAARWILKEVYGQEGLEIQHRYEPTVVNRTSVAAKFRH